MKTKPAKFNSHLFFRILIATFCIIIGTCVSYVLFNVYSPNQNALGAFCSVCMDVICMIILFILICSFAFETYKSTRATKLFAALLVATMWALFMDFLNWAFDGSLAFGNLTFWFTLGSLCMGAILACFFCLYLYTYMEENHNMGKMAVYARICAILNMVSFVVTFILALCGRAFTFVDGHYETGVLYDCVTVIPVVTLLFLVGYVIRYVKQIGIHDVLAAAGYLCFMVAGALLESEYRIGTTFVSVAVADIFIFVMLQNEIIALEKSNVQKWKERSKTDELTGLYNRFAYENDLNKLEKVTLPENFVYISFDVNALKDVNDTFGHTSGDELLIGVADCLTQCLGAYGKLYRVGGDEFIALVYVGDEQLQKIKANIEEISQNWSKKHDYKMTISGGYVTMEEAGKMSVREIAVLADHKMYDAKNEYYRQTGIERRRS